MTPGEYRRDFEIAWQRQAQGHSAHHIHVDPEKGVVLQGDGWGVAYAALAIHRRDGSDGRVLASTRLRHQQARCSEVVGDAIMVATDSRLLRLDRESLEPVQDWSTRVPRYTNTMVGDGNLIFMANWLRPNGRVFDLDSGHTRAITIGGGIVVLDRGQPVLCMALHEGTVHEIDIRNAGHRVIAKTEPGLRASLIDRRWLWILAGRWSTRQGVRQPPDDSMTLSLWDLEAGQRVHDVRIPDPAVHLAGDSVLGEVWAGCRAPGVWVQPMRILRIDAQTGDVLGTFDGPSRSQIASLHPAEGMAFIGQPDFQRAEANLICLRLKG